MTSTRRRRALLAALLPVLLFAAPRLLERHRGGAGSRVWQHSPITGHWYTLLNDNLDQPAAQALAESWGAYLACLNTAEEADWVVDRLLGAGCLGAYIGLLRGPNGRWRWADGSGDEWSRWAPDAGPVPAGADAVMVYADHPLRGTFTPLAEPDDAKRRIRCALVECERDPTSLITPWSVAAVLLWLAAAAVVLTLSVDWFGPPRLTARGLFISAAMVAMAAGIVLLWPRRTPLNEWLERPETGHWYRLAGPGLWYDDAEQLAERLGGRLAVIETADENAWLAANLLDRPLYGAWIGLREVERKGRWRWNDGSAPNYHNWVADGPEFHEGWPICVAHIFGRWSIPGPRLGQWRAVIAERWHTQVEHAYHPVNHALIERNTTPSLRERPRHLAGLLLAAVAPGLLLAAWRRWAGLAAIAAAGLTVALQPVPAASEPVPPEPPASRPADWPDDLADFSPPPGRTWADYRVSPVDSMPQARIAGGMTTLQGRRAWLNEYWLDLHEVTCEQYVRFLNDVQPPEAVRRGWIELDGDGAAIRFDGSRYAVAEALARHPVDRVTWHGARAYAWWAGRRLPSEAQWEHAAGDAPESPDRAAPAPVAGDAPSPRGLFDLRGNVSEWCEDWYCDNPVARGNATDPLGPWPDPRRVHRGGSCVSPAGERAVTARAVAQAGEAGRYLGFRCLAQGPPAHEPRRTGLWAPPDWPAWLAERDYAPPPGMNWADFRVAPVDAMPQVRIAAGEFLMGTPREQLETIIALNNDPTWSVTIEQWAGEMPRHVVELSEYWMDLHEVTVAQFRRFLAANPGHPRGLATLHWADDSPVAYVGWQDVVAYAAWVGRTLPTEAQWEKAARGGLENRLFAWGDAWDPARADWSHHAGGPIAQHPVNGFGIFDLIGGVGEWCRDNYHADAYGDQPRRDPVVDAPAELRVGRGGAQNSPMICLRPGFRQELERDFAWHNQGFRCVDDGTPAPQAEPTTTDESVVTAGTNAPPHHRKLYHAEYERLGGEAVLGKPLGPVMHGADGLVSGYSGKSIGVQEFERGALTELDGHVAGIAGELYRAWLEPHDTDINWNPNWRRDPNFAGGWRGWFGAIIVGNQTGLRSSAGTPGEVVRCEGGWLCRVDGKLELVPHNYPPTQPNTSVAALWEARGRWSGDFGWPLETWDVVTRGSTGARAWQQRFESATVYGFGKTWVLTGPWHDAWWRNGGYERLGFPLGNVESTPEGEQLEAQDGLLYRHGHDVFAVAGSLRAMYNERGGPAVLGLPLADEVAGTQRFERGTLP